MKALLFVPGRGYFARLGTNIMFFVPRGDQYASSGTKWEVFVPEVWNFASLGTNSLFFVPGMWFFAQFRDFGLSGKKVRKHFVADVFWNDFGGECFYLETARFFVGDAT